MIGFSLNSLYRVVGITKQAVFKHQKAQLVFDFKLMNLLVEVDELRHEHPGCGVEKMYDTLKPDFLGRDQFIEVFMELGYRVKRNKNYVRTTMPTHLRYPNLIEGKYVTGPNQVWQSDITYFYLNGRFYYIVFIIDVYSKKIMGHKVSDNMRADANIQALKIALREKGENGQELIHHSDRGSQYVEKRYLKLLSDNNIKVSMGKKAQENAYAERINGTIKNEYLKRWNIKDFKSLRSRVRRAITHYNEKRIHRNLPNKQSPLTFEKNFLSLSKSDRPRVFIPILE